jgi:tRNA(fMet)-specific endonuclease VapC
MKTNQNLAKIKGILESFQVLELEGSVYEVFASLSANLLSRDRSIGASNELIVVLTLCHDGKIVTRDNRFKKARA